MTRSEAEERGWTFRRGSRPGVFVAERAGRCVYGHSEEELLATLALRLRSERPRRRRVEEGDTE